jgi:RHS repeat-associated protein
MRLEEQLQHRSPPYQYEYGGPSVRCAADFGCGLLTAVTYPDGKKRTYVYNESANTDLNVPSALTGIIDENNSRWATYKYDSYGQGTSTEHAAGTYKYTLSGVGSSSTSTVDPLGSIAINTFSTVAGVRRLTQVYRSCTGCTSLGNSSTYTYDSLGNLIADTDFNGNKTCYANDTSRNLATAKLEGAASSATCSTLLAATTLAVPMRKTSTEWHATYRVAKRVAGPLRITTYSYNGDPGVSCAPSGSSTALVCRRSMQATTDTSGALGFGATTTGTARNWDYTYDVYGRVLTVDGPRSDVTDVTTYTYYANDPSEGLNRGMLHTVIDALGHATTFSNYHANGQPQTITDPNGLGTTLGYDARMRLSSSNRGGETTGYTYTPSGQLDVVTLPDGSTLDYDYDAAQRLIRVKDGLNNRIEYTLDNMGNRTAENSYDPSNALAKTLSRQYNNLNRLIKDIGGTSPTTQVTQYAYDPNGNLKTVTDALSRVTTNFYDALNRLTRVEDPFNGTTSPTLYTYDRRDGLTQVTDPKTLATTYTLNGFGELTAQVSPDTGTTTMTVDAAGNVLTRQDARGVTATFTYDALNRVTSAAYPAFAADAAETVIYTYDNCTNGVGRLCAIADKTGTTSYTYDVRGRVTSKSQVVAGLTQSVGYGYNSAGQLSTITTPSGQSIAYGYQNNRPVSVTVNGTTVLSGAGYEPFGPIGGWTWGNSTLTSPNLHVRLYDLDYRVTSVSTDQPQSGTTPICRWDFTWDAASRITALTVPTSSANSFGYGYDALDRLTSVTPTGSTQLFGFSYDKVGNRLTSVVSGTTTSYAYPTTSHRLSSLSGAQTLSYAYDSNGNQSAAGSVTWAYGGNNRPISVTTAGTTTFAINALGQRVRKATGSAATRFVYDEAGHLIGEYDDTGALIQETVWLSDLPVATIRPDGASSVIAYYVHPDHLGTPRAVTRPSDNALVWKWENTEPFGNSLPDENPSGLGVFAYNLRFPGQYFDSESGKHYNYLRDYDPSIGRYVESDPIGLKGGINTYAYVGADPLGGTDPRGLANSGPYPRPSPRPGDKSICQYYDDQCKKSGNCDRDEYACKAKQCCESFAENGPNQCTRRCLIDYDKAHCNSLTGAERNDCRRRAHVICYMTCVNAVEAWNSGAGRHPPPACIGAANAIGGMGLW